VKCLCLSPPQQKQIRKHGAK